ncbi:hypothetical protein OOJ91_34140 [Micromonospora lupini]|uniref:hypothetical protein n=1 Tax=Micromonospora lupini TaxID=285679 RepID=UPI00224C8FCC|nr:hypothetical protein [Micromonospora lupini]MCX5070890.1 hypothetical protein [Micromonospora lupini]
MSNSRAFRRRLARGPKVDTRNAFTVAHLGGALNAYYCTTCTGFTVTVDAARGTTPSMLACRAGDGSCEQMAVSLGYPKVWPARAPRTPAWEWYRPGEDELARLHQEQPAAYGHVVQGGLLLRAYRAGRGHQPVQADTRLAPAAPATVVTDADLTPPGPDLLSSISDAIERTAWEAIQ